MLTKDKIIEIAEKLFAQRGTDFSISELTDNVGIKKASFYAHFTSKEMLLHEIIDKEIEEYFFEVKEENRELKTIFFAILDYYSESKTKLYFWKRLLLFPPEVFEMTLIKKIDELSKIRFEIIKEIIEDYIVKDIIPKQDIDTVAISFLSLIHGMLSSVIIYSSDEIPKHYNGVWEIFWHGIGGKSKC